MGRSLPARWVTVLVPWPRAPGPREAFRALSSRPHPFFRLAAGGPRDLGRWCYLPSDPGAVLPLASARPSSGTPPSLLGRLGRSLRVRVAIGGRGDAPPAASRGRIPGPLARPLRGGPRVAARRSDARRAVRDRKDRSRGPR